MRLINHFIARSIILIIYMVLTSFPCSAEIHGDMELLKTVALANKSNYESILTWKCDIYEEINAAIGDSYKQTLNSECVMVYDQLEQAVRWNKTPQEHFIEEEGKRRIDETDNNNYYNSSMFKKATYYYYEGDWQPDEPNNRFYILTINDAKKAQGLSEFSFDPRLLLATPFGKPIYSRLMFLYENVKDSDQDAVNVSRSGDLVTLEMSNDKLIDKYVFDLSKGGTIVEWYNYNKTNNVVNTLKCTYENKSGAWILKTHYKTNYDPRQEDIYTQTRLLKFNNSVVSVPFEDDEFSIDKMGIKNGELIQDQIAGIMYRYGVTSGDIKELDMIDTPSEIIKSENLEETKDILQEDIVQEDVFSANNEANKTSKDNIILASESESTHIYTYVVIVAFIFGLAIVGYILTRKIRESSNSV